MCGIATPMAQAEYGVAKKSDIPVIFTAVTDPVAAELANADGTPVGEITGTSDKLPVEAQLKMIRQILPEAKNIGIMYTTSEVNSESAIAEYKELAPQYGFEIVDTGISSSADIALAADTLINKVDCIIPNLSAASEYLFVSHIVKKHLICVTVIINPLISNQCYSHLLSISQLIPTCKTISRHSLFKNVSLLPYTLPLTCHLPESSFTAQTCLMCTV